MLLCIDIGNSCIALGLFKDTRMVESWKLATDRDKTSDEYAATIHHLFRLCGLDLGSVEVAALACVVPEMVKVFRELIQRKTGNDAFIITGGTKSEIKNCYDDPSQLGADRLANAACLWREYGAPACSVDLGTATNFDLVVGEGRYTGGAIAPGFSAFVENLDRKTSQLPHVPIIPPPKMVASNTTHGIQSGVYWGYISLLEGMIHRMQDEVNMKLKVVGTGGWVDILKSGTQIFHTVDPFLTLKGIRYIWESNH